jgi:hypothetical protein
MTQKTAFEKGVKMAIIGRINQIFIKQEKHKKINPDSKNYQ